MIFAFYFLPAASATLLYTSTEKENDGQQCPETMKHGRCGGGSSTVGSFLDVFDACFDVFLGLLDDALALSTAAGGVGELLSHGFLVA